MSHKWFLAFCKLWDCSKQTTAVSWKWTDYCKLDAFFQMETNLRGDNENMPRKESKCKEKDWKNGKEWWTLSDCQNLKNDVFRRSLRQHVSEKICLWNNSLKLLGCYSAVVEQMKDRKCLWKVCKRVNLNEVISREHTDFQGFFAYSLVF